MDGSAMNNVQVFKKKKKPKTFHSYIHILKVNTGQKAC